jgi:hypothetical protein
MSQVLRRGVVVLGVVLALAPFSAYADNQGNQDALDAIKAQKAWLQNMPPMEQGVALGQIEIANAKAIAKMLTYDSHAQSRIPNTMQQYSLYCDAVIQQVASQLANAQAMASAKPWDSHAQSELANAAAQSHMLWDIIGDTYAGNPWAPKTVIGPMPLVSDDAVMLVADDAMMVAADDEMVMAADEDALLVADDAAEAID